MSSTVQGFQTTVGDDVYINFNCCFNDVGKSKLDYLLLFLLTILCWPQR